MRGLFGSLPSPVGFSAWESMPFIMLLDGSNKLQLRFPLLVTDALLKECLLLIIFKVCFCLFITFLFEKHLSQPTFTWSNKRHASTKSNTHLYSGHPSLLRIALISPQNTPGALFIFYSLPFLPTLTALSGRSSNSGSLHPSSSCCQKHHASRMVAASHLSSEVRTTLHLLSFFLYWVTENWCVLHRKDDFWQKIKGNLLF